MKRLLGPVLYAESQPDPGRWTFWLKLYLQGGDGSPPPLKITFFDETPTGPREATDVTISEPQKAADFSGLVDPGFAGVYWGWHVELPRGATARVMRYRVSSTDARVPLDAFEIPEVVIPAQGQPPRMAFFSCNGTPTPSELNGQEPLALWDAMLDEHQRMAYSASPDGFNLLIGGGDQIYADSIFDAPMELPTLWRFAHRLSNQERVLFKLGDTWEQERAKVLAAYVRLYCLHWGEGSGISEMLARAPGLFIWDDHDIFDGWGSQELLQISDVYRMIYPEAARAYEAFQLGRENYTGSALPNPIPDKQTAPHYFQALSFPGTDCDLEVVGLDLRSGRTDTRVLSDEQWRRFDAWRQEDVARSRAAPQRKRQVVLISSIPVVYRRFTPQMELMASTAIGIRSAGLRDDMLDSWESRLHRDERARLLKNLLSHGKDARCAVTILTGDVHVGGHGRITSQEPAHLPDGRPLAVIEQLISSGVVHPPVGGLLLLGMDIASSIAPDHSLGPLIDTRLMYVDTGGVVITERNWLEVELERAPRSELRLQWYAEKSKRLPTKVVVTPPGS